MSAGPIDPRLLRYASSARWFFVAGGVVGLLQTASVVGAAWFATALIVGLIDGRTLEQLLPELAAFVGVVVARSLLVWLLDVIAARGAAGVKSQLRVRVVGAVAQLGPRWLAGRNSARVTTVVTQGLDALDGYFAKYLPQLILTAIATPVLVLVLLWQDLPTAVIVVVTLPLIPVFMVLIGLATQAVQKKQWAALTALATGFLDVVDGLSTLTVFGRQHRQAARIDRVTDEYRTRTMAVLRVSFVSGFVLELAGSLSVAVVAVSIGLRLVSGELGLAVGLFVLLLTPEAYAPLRQVGAQFHAAADGVAAADEVFEILDAAASIPASRPAVEVAASDVLSLEGVTVTYDGRVAVSDFSASFEAGRITALAGESGAGKSSVVAAILGFVAFEGSVTGAADVAWAGQRPGLFAGTVEANVTLGSPAPSSALLAEAMRLAVADLVDPALVLGSGGSGLSGGQAQRVAVARAYYRALERSCPVVVLDEPSSALDSATEAELVAGMRELADRGVAVVVVSHRTAVLEAADRVIELRAHAVVAP